MARNVGSIEVTVDADTGQLKAQLVKDGRAAGADAKRAIEKELRNVEAELGLNTTRARAELRKFQTAIDRIDGDIEIGFDEEGMRADLARVQEEIDAVQGDIEVSLDKSSVQAVKAEIKEMEAGLSETLDFQLRVDPRYKAQFEAQIKFYENRILELNAKLDLDPTALEAKLKALQEQKRDLEFGLEFAPQARAQLELQLRRIQVEDRTIELRATLDEKQVLAQLKALQRDQEVHLGIDTAEATAQYEVWAERLEANKLAATITGDFTDFNLAVRELKAKLALERFNIKVDTDIDVDPSAVAKAKAELNAAGRGAGESFFEGFGSGGQGIIPNEIQKWFPLIGLALQPLGPLIEGAVGGAAQVAASAISAIAGAAGAAAPLVAGLAASLGAVVIGSLGVGKGLKEVVKEFGAASDEGRAFNLQAKNIQKALGPLGPAARDVVVQFSRLFPQLQAFQNMIAEQVFAGLGMEIARLSKETIPDLATSLTLAGQSANRFFHELSASVQGMDFTGMFMAVQPAVDSLGRAIATVARSLQPLLMSAAPAARELATWIEQAASGFTDLVQRGAQSGAITRFLLEGLDSLKQWASLTVEVGKALFTLFQAGKRGGDGMVASLTGIVKQWNAWMTSIEGQQALADFFAGSREILSDLKPLLSGLVDGLKAIFAASSGDSFRVLAADLGQVVRVMGELLAIMSHANITGTFVMLLRAVADAIEPIIPDLQAMASAIGTSLASAVRTVAPAIEGLAQIVGLLARSFAGLPDGIQELIVMFGLLAAAGAKIGFDKISSGFLNLRDNITLLKPALQDVGSSLSTITAGFKQGDLDKISKGFSNLGPALVQSAKSAASAAGVALAAGLGIAFGAQMAAEADSMAGAVTGVMTIIGSSISAFAAGGPIVGAAALGIGIISTAFMGSAREAEKAKAEVDDFAKALVKLRDTGNSADAVTAALKHLGDQGKDVREAFRTTGLSVGDFAKDTVTGFKSLTDSTADWIAKITGANDPLVNLVRTGKVSLDDLAKAFAIMDGHSEEAQGSFANLGDKLAALGIKSGTAFEMFHFLGNQVGELTKANDEMALSTFEAGNALDKTGSSANTAADGINTSADSATQAAIAMADFETKMSNVQGTATAAASGFTSISDAAFGIVAPMSDAEQAMIGVGQKADAAAKASDAMGKALDRLVSPALDGQEALSNYEAAIDDLTKSLEENGKTVDLGTEKGRANAEAIRGSVKSITDWGEAALKQGVSGEAVNTMMQNMRGELVKQVMAFGMSEQAANDYIDQLGLTPPSISTAVLTPGLLDANKNILGYDFDLDGVPDNVSTEVFTPNLQAARDALRPYIADIDTVPDSVLTAFLQENFDKVHANVTGLTTDAETLSNTPAEVTISETGADETQAAADNVFQKIGSLDTLTGTGTIAVAGADTAAAATDNVFQKIGSLNTLTGTGTVGVQGAEQAKTDTDAVGTSVESLNSKQGEPTVAIIGNAIVMVQLGAIQQQIDALNKSAAHPNVTIDNFGTVVAQTAVMIALVGKLDGTKANPIVTLPTYAVVVAQTLAMMVFLASLNASRANPIVTLPTYGTVVAQIAVMAVALGGLDRMSASPSVTLDGYSTVINELNNIENTLSRIDGRVATTTVRNVTQNITENITGGMAGAMINGPQTMNVGERGLREALIPLDLPLNRVDPSVRGLAELIRGEAAGPGATIGRQVNVTNYIEVTSNAVSPEAVAAQVMNRAAAMAN